MTKNEDFIEKLTELLNNPNTRPSIVALINKIDIDDKKRATQYTADELYNYLEHINILASIKGSINGDVTDFSAFSFGKAASAQYRIDEDGTITVNLDFSSVDKAYDSSSISKSERRIDPSLVDFDVVSDDLMSKYGVMLNFSYHEGETEEKEWNGSGDMEEERTVVKHVVDSKMVLSGKLLEKKPQEGIQLG